MKRLPLALAALTLIAQLSTASAQAFDDKFRQLDELLPTPTETRTASGAPGHAYWQQRADYRIRVTLDEAKRAVSGTETVTYHNNSPDTLATCGCSWTRTCSAAIRTTATSPATRRAKPGARPAQRVASPA
jgi:hypothetical protein